MGVVAHPLGKDPKIAEVTLGFVCETMSLILDSNDVVDFASRCRLSTFMGSSLDENGMDVRNLQVDDIMQVLKCTARPSAMELLCGPCMNSGRWDGQEEGRLAWVCCATPPSIPRRAPARRGGTDGSGCEGVAHVGCCA